MLLVKTCNFFHYLFSPKIRLEIAFNNILDRKGSFVDYKNKIFQSPRNPIFPNGLTNAFGQKIQFFFQFLFSVKIRLEIRFNNVLDRKKLFLVIKAKFFQVPKIVFFQRG